MKLRTRKRNAWMRLRTAATMSAPPIVVALNTQKAATTPGSSTAMLRTAAPGDYHGQLPIEARTLGKPLEARTQQPRPGHQERRRHRQVHHSKDRHDDAGAHVVLDPDEDLQGG